MYDNDFYDMINDGSYKSAKVIVPEVLWAFANAGFDAPGSVVDWGCGQGAWLRAFQEEGLDVTGYDGSYVDRSKLLINDFHEIDLNQTASSAVYSFRDISDKYDLAISLEVAEHLEGENADAFVELVASSSDVVLFSAAIPGQGGVGHVNEQWPSYWVEKFQSHGFKYVSDFIRKKTWNNMDVEPWYKQNVLLLSRENMHLPQGWDPVVHPIVWDHIRGAG